MNAFVTGNTYPEFAGRSEGAYMAIDDTGLLLTLLYNNPTASEVRSMSKYSPLAVCVKKNMICFTSVHVLVLKNGLTVHILRILGRLPTLSAWKMVWDTIC